MVWLKNQQLKQWSIEISRHLSHLSLSQLRGLATWSFGMVMTKSSSVTRISKFMAQLNDETPNTVRTRLKEWYQDSEAKKGTHRLELKVNTCFAPLLKWILSLWPRDCNYLPLAIDTTNIRDELIVLSVNVLIGGSGVSVAWKVVRATEKGSWQPFWKELLQSLKDVIPDNFLTIVCADRGLYADWLYEQIQECGWHPMLRINHHQGTFRLHPNSSWRNLSELISHAGACWSGKVTCFKTNPIDCTLLGCWQPEDKGPWLIITDLDPDSVDILWYHLRYQIECNYRDIKSDAWQWHHTRLSDPLRAERIWLAIAVATLWTLSVGGSADNESHKNKASQTHHHYSSNSVKKNPVRHLSCFLLGLLTIVADFLNGKPVVLPPLYPEPWPTSYPQTIPNTS